MFSLLSKNNTPLPTNGNGETIYYQYASTIYAKSQEDMPTHLVFSVHTLITATKVRGDSMRLCDLHTGESATVHALLSVGSIRRRLLDIGLIEGTAVECVGRSPGGDPAAYLIRGAVIAIRDKDAADIIIEGV